ncbi:MAG: hypothetical protein ACLPRE_12865 [Limisphaerales bacterium]
MKTRTRIFIWTLPALLTVLSAQAQVGLTVSPAITSNTYTGVVTLNITGLTNTEQVTVQRWIDGNANGVIDAGEWMMDAFKISDGGAMVNGGVTNLNVPFDSNSATGAITTALNFAGSMAIENMTGHFVYAVTSPTGRFAPVTATFQVTNAALNQSISGVVYSNGVPQPYAVVVVQDLQAQNPVGSVQADGGGNYFLTLPPGNYGFIATAPDCYFDQSAAPTVTLTNGASATNDLFLTGGVPNTISGNVYDAGNSNGIGGLLVTMQSGSLFEVTFTDTNGNYSAAVTPAFWEIQPPKERLARRAYVLPEATFQVDATGGSVSNANIALPKGNALFYGRITDNLNNPFANVEVDASTDDNNYGAKGYSDANGDYTVAVLGDLTNDWNCNVNNGAGTPIGGYILNAFQSTTNAPNQVNLQNFVALPAMDTITGHVQNNSGTNIIGVNLVANAVIGGNNYQTLDGTTDNSGDYSLAVAPGQWYVEFLTGGHDSGNLDVQGYVDVSAPHIVNIPPTNVVLNITVYPIGTPFITSPQRFGSQQFGFTINGLTNVTYTVQVSTNLASGWSNLFSLTLTNSIFPVEDINATNRTRFYRVQKN